MTIKQLFGKNLKYYRFQRGMSQERLAELMNTTVTYISNIETGRNGVTFGKIEDFCRVLNIKPHQLFSERANNRNVVERVDIYRKTK